MVMFSGRQTTDREFPNLSELAAPPAQWLRAAGTVTLLLGLGRRGFLGKVLLVAGGVLILWGAAAKNEASRSPKPGRGPTRGLDKVAEASEESFPASDPPSWTPS